jgi:hypothetical protein
LEQANEMITWGNFKERIHKALDESTHPILVDFLNNIGVKVSWKIPSLLWLYDYLPLTIINDFGKYNVIETIGMID